MVSRSKITRQTLAQEVASRLRDEILSGTLSPGQRLIVPTLEEWFGVSHIPIREALRELQAEALVQPGEGQGLVVASVDLQELSELYHLRRLLEVDAIRHAFDRYTPDHLAEFKTKLAALKVRSPEVPEEDWWAAHKAYHWAFLEPGLSGWSRRVLHLIWQSAERYQRLYTLVFGSVDDANQEHEELLQAASQDLEQLLELWVRHLNHTKGSITRGYRAHHGNGTDTDQASTEAAVAAERQVDR